jgi:hypothetical protein
MFPSLAFRFPFALSFDVQKRCRPSILALFRNLNTEIVRPEVSQFSDVTHSKERMQLARFWGFFCNCLVTRFSGRLPLIFGKGNNINGT